MSGNSYIMMEKELITGNQNIIGKNTSIKNTENIIMTNFSRKLYKLSIDRTINSRIFMRNLLELKFTIFYEFSKLLVRPFNVVNYSLVKEKIDDYNYIKKIYETLTPLLHLSLEKHCNTKNIHIVFDYNNDKNNKNGIMFDILYSGKNNFEITYSNYTISFSDPDNTTLIVYVPVNFVITCIVDAFSEKASQEQKNINTIDTQYILEDVYQIISSYAADSFKINAFISYERNKFIQDINQFIIQLIEFKQERLLYNILSADEILKLKSQLNIIQNLQRIDDTQYDFNFINNIRNRITTYITSLYPRNNFISKKTIYNFNELFINSFSDEIMKGLNPFVMYKIFTELNNFEVKKILDTNRNILDDKSVNLLYNTYFTLSIDYLRNTMNCSKSDIISIVHYISNTLLFVFLYLGFNKNNIRLIEDYINNITTFLNSATNYNFNLSQDTYSVKQIAKKINENIKLFNSIKKLTDTDLQRFVKLLDTENSTNL